jgi:lipopolysaccharide transport system permease protein
VTETVYSAESDVRHPLRFLAATLEDLRHTPRVAWQLFRKNLEARYRRAWLGYAWLLLPTIGMTLVWVYIQSRRLIDIAAPDVPYPVYVLAGMTLWQTFVDALNAPLQQLTSARQLVTRSRVPQEALIAAGALEVLLSAAARLLVLAVLVAAYDVPIDATVLYAPLGIAALTVLGLALGVFLAPIGMLYEDVGRALAVITALWFFLTPVIYQAPRSGILRFNPVTPLLETTRSWLISSNATASGFLPVTAAATALLLVAWALLRLARPHVVERLG